MNRPYIHPTEFDLSDELEMEKHIIEEKNVESEKFVTVKLSLEGMDELSVIFLQDQYETVLQDINEGTGGEDLIWAFQLVLQYNMSSKDYESYIAENS